MKAELQDAGPCRKVLHVTATAEEIEPTFEEVIQAFTRIAKIRGFRPGKAPRTMVERQYAKDIHEEAEGAVLPRFYRSALKEHELSPVAVVSMNDVSVKRGEGLSFKVTVDVPPDFEMPRYGDLVVQDAKAEVTDAQVDEAIDELRDRYSRFEETTDGVVDREDLAQIDYEGRCGSEPVASLAPKHASLGAGKDFWMLVGEREFLPGFSDALLGAKCGESREIPVTFPANYQVTEVAGLQAVYSVAVKRIRRRRRPEINKDFLALCSAETEEALRERVRADLLVQAERNERMRKISEIERRLLEETKFELPQSVLAEETDLTLRGMIRNIIMEGGSRELIEKNRERIAGQAEQLSRDRVRLSYILSRIADQEKIAVEDSEVEDRIVQLAAGYNMTPQRLHSELTKRNGLDGVRSDIRSEKTMNLLLQKATDRKGK
jgi:trigger factor